MRSMILNIIVVGKMITLFSIWDTLEQLKNRMEELGAKEITRIMFLEEEKGVEVEWN